MDEEIQKALDLKFKGLEDKLKLAQDEGASKDEILKLHEQIKTQGQAIEDFIQSQKRNAYESVKEQLENFLIENKDELSDIYQKGSGTLEFVPKAVGSVTTGSGSNATTPSHLMHTNLQNISLRDDSALLNIASVSETGLSRFSYTEAVPKEGGYGFVAEGAEKPQVDFQWVNRFPEPKKAAAHMILTEEASQDVKGIMSVVDKFLKDKHDLFKINGMYFGTGLTGQPLGATEAARSFVATGLTDVFEHGTANFMDVVNAIITDIYRTQTYVDEPSHEPNIVLINPIDFFTHLVGAKDKNGLPLYPQAGMFNQVRIGGVVIKPWIKITAGNIFVADMTKYHVVNYIPFTIRIGWINSQFITNMFTVVGESRYYQYIKNLDLGAFVYDSIATVKTAIEKAAP